MVSPYHHIARSKILALFSIPNKYDWIEDMEKTQRKAFEVEP